MNIFVTDPCPIKSAQTLSDKLVNKMLVETGQLLCGALQLKGFTTTTPYQMSKSQLGHPATKWASECSENFNWLLAHFEALNKEYMLRSKKECGVGAHTSFIKVYDFAKMHSDVFEPKGELKFILCFDDKHRIIHKAWSVFTAYKIVIAYKHFYGYKTRHTWTRRKIPFWLKREDVMSYLLNKMRTPPIRTFKKV